MLTKTLESRAAKLRETLEAPTEKELAASELERVESELSTKREAEHKATAVARLASIKDEYARLAQEIDADEKSVEEAADAYRTAVDRVNTHVRQLTMLRAEANALVHRFDCADPGLLPVSMPAGCWAAVKRVAGTPALSSGGSVRHDYEREEGGLRRKRRNYGEVRGTPGHRIIRQAGPKPWPKMTPEEEASAAYAERHRLR